MKVLHISGISSSQDSLDSFKGPLKRKIGIHLPKIAKKRFWQTITFLLGVGLGAAVGCCPTVLAFDKVLMVFADASKLFSHAAASVRQLAGCWADIGVADDHRVIRAVNCAYSRPSGFTETPSVLTEILSHIIVKYII